MTRERREVLSVIPSVDRILESAALTPVLDRWGRRLVVGLVREDLERLRRAALEVPTAAADLARDVEPGSVAARVAEAAERLLTPRPRVVINATGIVVHTNLGRALLSETAANRLADTARNYVDLEYDLERGARGDRQAHLAPLLRLIFPGHAALVVNNNAAAIVLALRTLARGREVLVSRGELVEIGGAFRVPDMLRTSGARLREVGTTNRTRVEDYEAALGPKSGAILKVHTSNFQVVGFAEQASCADLAELSRGAGVPLVVDWGSGDLVDLEPYGIADERPVGRLLEDGADLVTFSGDKLLGGPQAGFVVGRPDLVRRLARDPLARICRIDRVVLGALHATLSAYVTGREFEEVPTLRMLQATRDTLVLRARHIADRVRPAIPGLEIAVVDGVSRTGGGSSPVGELPTALVAIGGAGDAAAHRLERRLRSGEPPVIARVHEGRILLDPRTVPERLDDVLVRRLVEVLERVRR